MHPQSEVGSPFKCKSKSGSSPSAKKGDAIAPVRVTWPCRSDELKVTISPLCRAGRKVSVYFSRKTRTAHIALVIK